MLKRTAELDELDRKYAREFIAPLNYKAALAQFAAMWTYARSLRPDEFPGDWREDVQADIELARVLNDRPG